MSSGEITTFNGRRCTKVRRAETDIPPTTPPLSTDNVDPSATRWLTTPRTMETSSPDSDPGGNSNGALDQGMVMIIVATVASIAAIIILLLVFICFRRRHRRRARARELAHMSQMAEKQSDSQAVSPSFSKYSVSTRKGDGLVEPADTAPGYSYNLVESPGPVLQRSSGSLIQTAQGAIVVGNATSATASELSSPGNSQRFAVRQAGPGREVHISLQEADDTPPSRSLLSRLFPFRRKPPARHPKHAPNPSEPVSRVILLDRVDRVIPSPSLHMPSDLRLPASINSLDLQTSRKQDPPAIHHTRKWSTMDSNGSIVILPGHSPSGSGLSGKPLRLTASELSRWRHIRSRSTGSSATHKSDPFDLEEPGPSVHDDDAADDGNDETSVDTDGSDDAIPCPNGVGVAVAVPISRPRQDTI